MKAFLAAAALAALPVTAGAVTVGVSVTDIGSGYYYGSGSVTTSTDVGFEFTVPVALENFTVEISGTGRLTNGATLTYSVLGATPVSIVSPFSETFVIGTFGPGTYTVAYDFTGSPIVPLSLTTTVYGETPATVPVPAAGALAAAGIAALGAVAASRRKSA